MLLDGLKNLPQFLSSASNPQQWFVDWIRGGETSFSGETITEETALRCAAVKAAVSVLAETVASVSLDVFKVKRSGGKDLAWDHPVHHLLHDQPNEETSSFNWRETKQGHLGTYGNAYSEIRRTVGGQILGLWQRSPKAERTKPFRAEVDQKIYYECRDERGQLEANIPARDMFHVPGFGFDGLVGYSPISMGKQPIGVSRAAERYAGELFANDARPNGVISVDGELSQEAYERTKKAFNESGSTHGQRHKVKLLEGGATFAETQMNPEDVQMIESRKFSVEEIARLYRMSPHLLQDLTHGTFSNITELGRQFIIYTMMPWFRRWEAEINRKLLKPPLEARFNAKAFLEGDHKARMEMHKAFWGMGRTLNEILEIEGENSIGPEGDTRFVPVNMQPIKRAINPPEPPPAPVIPGQPPAKPGKLDREVYYGLSNDGTLGDVFADNGELVPQHTPDAAVLEAAQAVLAEALARMTRKETRACERASKRPDAWIDFLDTFYAKHAQTMRDALGPAVRNVLTAEGGIIQGTERLEQIVQEHIERHREELLTAAECQPINLPRRVAETVKGWSGNA